ncbi:hypothetical protein [Algibacter sp. 2305UL17-15]|uniref:hypothetical protein n=1 Tax=Algibacter sp. 2305UL17-15 TaxID=3231268 RepID=UPI0034581C61
MIKIVGKINKELSARILNVDENIIGFFVDYTDISIPKKTFFKEVYLNGIHENIDCELIYITNESLFELDFIEEGYKTICFFKFHGNIPKIVNDIPYVKDWYDYKDHLSMAIFSTNITC